MLKIKLTDKFFPFFLVFICLTPLSLLSQEIQNEIRLNFNNNYTDKSESNISYNSAKTLAILFPFNPIFLIENKKFYAGITKEISVGKFPFGRLAAEYSLIFRKTHLNQLRFSYNLDIPLESSDLVVLMLSVGCGYFTDFSKEGYFPQASLGMLIPFDDAAGINTYLKFRNTFVTDDNESDIFDFSFGLGVSVYL